MVRNRIGLVLLAATLWVLGGCAANRGGSTFVHVTDTHVSAAERDGSTTANVAAMYREISRTYPRAAFVMNTGDFVETGTAEQYQTHKRILANLSLPWYGVPGNHDVRWNPLGKEGFERGVGPLYRSWDHGDAHFVLLDSTVLLSHLGHVDQEQLDWLAKDLRKVGPSRPIVIGMHHPIGRQAVYVDNAAALLDVVSEYNVCLWLFGHGHSDLAWNINGAPGVEAKGLYQGSYHVVHLNDGRLRVTRRAGAATRPAAATTMVAQATTNPPTWTRRPGRSVSNDGNRVVVKLPDNVTVAAAEMSVDDGSFVPMRTGAGAYLGDVRFEKMLPGEHVATVRLTLADGMACFNAVPLMHEPSGGLRRTWQTDLRSAIQSRLVRDGDAVYVTTMGGELVALRAENGEVKWRAKTAGPAFSTPCVSEGTIYFGSADHHAYAVDAATGQVKWKTQTAGGVFAGPAVAQGIVCVPSVDLTIHGLDAQTGQVRWKTPCAGVHQSRVATDGQRFLLGGWDNHLRCLDARTGRPIWSRKLGSSMYYSPAIASPAIGNGKVFVTSNDGVLHAMSIATGDLAWEFDGKKVGYSGPLYHENRIYVAIGDTGRVYCFDADNGQRIWESSAGSVIYDSSFAFGGGNVFIGSVNGTVSAFAAKDGALRWQYRLGPGHLLASPAADERRMYIGSMNGKVTALPVNK